MLKRVFASALVLSVATLAPAAQAAEIVLPTPVTSGANLNALQYGDFTVYSLAYLNYLTVGSEAGPFSVDSSPGQIDDLIVVATGTNNGPLNNNASPILSGPVDNPYRTPDGNGAPPRFSTTTVADPGGAGQFLGDGADTWDISVSALNDFLGGDDLVFFFNLNETDGVGSSILSRAQDILAYAKVTLHDSDHNLLGTYELTSGTFPGINYNTPYDFGDGDAKNPAYVHGEICVDATNNVLYYLGTCAAAEAAIGNPNNLTLTTVNQNLGANSAAFAVTNFDLSALLRTVTTGYLSVDLRLGELNNGYEQVFIGRAPNSDVPEPAALGLLGLGLGAVALRRRKR